MKNEKRKDNIQPFIELIKKTLDQTLTPSSPCFILACRELTTGRGANLLIPLLAAADVMQ